ncbi:hypothetical protein DVW12_16930 [Clostridium botulinum]|nr:hypothetical protein [Clostridium botulinum]
MNKKELLDLVGKGYINIGDAQIEGTITQVGGSDYLHVTQKAINECTTDHEFSGGWVEYIKDEDINELELAILTIHKKMLEQSAICKKEPLVLTTIKGTNKLISNTKKEYLMETFRNHFEIYYCPYSEPEYSINRPLLIDGKLFLPLWSWWLEKGCYIIKKTK